METKLHIRSFDSKLAPDAFSRIPRMPVYVILDNLRSAFNVGSIVRTADCSLIQKLFFCGITAHPPNTKLEKTSLGALPYVPWEFRSSAFEASMELKRKGVPVIALELTDSSQMLWQYKFKLPVGLVLGNEALGVSHDVLKIADVILEIPMLGFKNSINVAVAFGIVAYEIQRQFQQSISKTGWKEK